jgi:hypothetical protein
MHRPRDEYEFRDLDTGPLDIVVIVRRIRRWVVVTIAGGSGIRMGMQIPPEVPIRVVAVMDVVVVPHGPPDGDGRGCRRTDAVVHPETQFTGTHRVVERAVRERLQTLELGAEIVKRAGIDGTSQPV